MSQGMKAASVDGRQKKKEEVLPEGQSLQNPKSL